MKSKTKYPVHKLEFLCLKWAITDQFHKYLYANTFDVYTDNNPLTYVLTTAKLDAMGHRWVTGLANQNFHSHYKLGKSNVEADALSKIDWEKCDETIQAIVTNSQTAKCTAQNLWDKFIVHYGLPEKILTDQGYNFESDVLKALCEIAKVKTFRTSGYHPQTNGQCECFNATIINMLGTLPEKPKSTWREQVPTLVHAYNCKRNNVTGFIPYCFM